VQVFDARSEFFGYAHGVVFACAGEQHGEFFAADACHEVIRAHGQVAAASDLARQISTDVNQRRVAGRMSALVVETLEVIEIEQQQRLGSSDGWRFR
jgi:hypothetical protein